MKATLVGDSPTHYTMHDGKSPFRVPKAGLSDAMHAKIRAMGQKMAGGGEAEDIANLESGVGSTPAAKPRDENGFWAVPPAYANSPEGKAAIAAQMAAKQAELEHPTPSDDVRMDNTEALMTADPPQAPATPAMLARPQEAPTAAQVAQVAPNAPVKPAGPGLGEQAARAEYDVEVQRAKAQAEGAVAQGKVLEEAARQQRDMQARAAQQRDTDMAGIQKQRDAIANMDTTIDSGRWWASRSTPGKILAGLGLALGAVGAGNDGVNRAVGIIDGAINRDLENQKHSHELMFRKMGMGLQAAESAYSLHRQGQQDDIVASEAAKGTMLQLALNQTDQMLAKTSEPAAKAKLMAVRAQLAAQQGAANAKAAQQAFDNNIKTQELDIKRMEAGQKAAGASFVSPGYSLMPGAKPGEVELKDARTSLTEKKNIDAALIKLKGLIKDSWLVPGSAEAAQAQSLIAKLKVGYKNMATLGALSGSDYALIDAAIPDPTSMKGHFTPDKTLIARLDQFGKTANTDLHNKLGTLGIVKDADAPQAAPAQSAEAQAARQWLAANPTDPRAAAVRAKLGL